ncbi:MAG: dienelactone hydrolase family protein [Myxococcota bacterium]
MRAALLAGAFLLAGVTAAQPTLAVHGAALGPEGSPHALVVALHPWGSRGRAMARLVEAAAIPCAHRVLAPDGPLPHGRGRSWLRDRVADEAPTLPVDATGAADAVAALLRDRRERIVVTGLSQGGVVAYALAARHPGLADVVVAAAGLLPEDVAVRPGAGRIVMVHGERDAFVPFARARAGLRRLRAAGRQTERRTLPAAGHRLRGALRTRYLSALRDAVACPN